MVDVFVVPMFHHGGNFVRESNRSLVYKNGKVKKFPKMDLDFVDFGDLITLFKGLGYPSYKTVYWYDPRSPDIESGLHILIGDARINAMRENKMKNTETDKFYVYFDHPVDKPKIVEDARKQCNNPDEGEVLVDDESSSSDDGYESTEDEPYKPQPPGFESNNDDDDTSADEKGSKRQRVMKRKKKVVSPKKTNAKKIGTKRNRKTWKKMGQSNGPNEEQTRKNVGPDPNVQPNKGPEPNRDQHVRFYVSLIQDDDDDPVYDYESENLHTLISSDDESNKHKFPEFNDDYEHGEERFELGTRFATIERFKEVVKDSFIAEGRELRWIKNDKEIVRVGCMDDECPWLVHLSYNKSLQCYQVKTYKNDHTCARDMGSNEADQHWISLKVEKRMSTQPHMRTSEVIDFLREEFSLTAHPKMVYRAVREARERIMGNEREQYSNVRDYLFEILRSNPGSRAKLCVTPIPQSSLVFDKLYICLEACKQGFKSGCRPLIHLDGCFLKTYYGRQLLTVVAQDANNQFYVVAYGVASLKLRSPGSDF
ncbi:uncharacterized protein [Arachis hypogaea]|uniref:uncharacterized protein n=1 Tax=Arachis hypogaea TaxID=3818 RepID=UPI003B2228B0